MSGSKAALSVLSHMGNTPVHELKSGRVVPDTAGRVIIKLEEFNPGESVKARVALGMIRDAEERELLRPGSGQVLIEPTGGNTGTGLALVGTQRGYRVVLVVPDDYVSPTRLKLLKIRGATVILSDHTTGNDSHIVKVREMVEENRDYVWLDQFSNPANPKAHYDGTGVELLRDIPKIDCFVAGIGSGGTITGVGRRLREHLPNVRIVGVQPQGCDSLQGVAIKHRIQGLAVGTLPPILDVSLIDEMISVTFDSVMDTIRRVAVEEGLFVGLSSGANITAAIEVATRLGRGATVVTISPDSGKNYPDIFLLDGA